MGTPSDDTSPEGIADEGATPRPVVVVQYRRGWLSQLTTPLLILVAAGAILSHRVKIADWRGLSALLPKRETVVVVEKVIVKVPAPAAGTPPTIGAVANPPIEVVEAHPPMPDRPEPGPPVARTLAIRPLPLDIEGDERMRTTRAEQEILRESDEKRKKRLAEAALQDRRFEEEALAEVARQAEELVRQRRAIQDERKTFREAVHRALGPSSSASGPEIRALCQQRGVYLDPERRMVGTSSSISGLSASNRKILVERLRAIGKDEAFILDQLVRSEAVNRGARSGPKTLDDVIVRAARQLLEVPVKPSTR